jgi:hypothetical protein
MKIKLTGWKAVIVVVAVIGFVIFKLNVQTKALQTEGVEEVKRRLLLESARAALPDMRKALENPAENTGYLEKMAKDLQLENFEIVSVTRHGVGERIVARVEVRYKGESVSEGMGVRYFRMKYSTVTGWRVVHETTKLNYYLAAFGR